MPCTTPFSVISDGEYIEHIKYNDEPSFHLPWKANCCYSKRDLSRCLFILRPN